MDIGTAKEVIEFLFQIIDDIDTASDMAKSNLEAYQKRVNNLQKRRWETGITSDGYTLDFSNMVVPPSGVAPSLGEKTEAKDSVINYDILTGSNADITKLSLEVLEEHIAKEEYFTYAGKITICFIHMKNGYITWGLGAAVSKENFNIEIGKGIARTRALDQVYSAMGYALQAELVKKYQKKSGGQ